MKNFYILLFIALGSAGSLSVAAQPAPVFNSYDEASAVILLDFDGHTVSGTSWNVSGSFSSNASGLTNNQITEVFNRVSEDFRPFNINVTTSEAKYNQAPINKRIRIIITTSHEWYGTAAGGVAFLNSFIWGDNTPAFVFSSLFKFNVKNISESASHEAGHTFGLRHQSVYDGNCVKLSDYNWGQGTGEIGWAPIMGAGYNQNMTLWHNGPSSNGCSSIQSDLSVISGAANGFGYRTDDHSNVYTSATNANFINDQFNIKGIVERNDDKDLFRFTIPADGRFQLNAIPYNVGSGNAGSDLDLQVEFLDASYNLLGTYNPGILLNSIIDTFISRGTYYIRVEGKGNIYAPEYASLGSYSMQGIYSAETKYNLLHFLLNGQAEKENHILNWLIDTKENVITQVVEVSKDGRNFITLEKPGKNDRTYQYRPQENKPLKYRIHARLENQKDYYSNVITIRQGTIAKPQLIGNIIVGTNLSVNSPANYSFKIMDQNGRLMEKGNIIKGFNSINTKQVTNGVYIIRFTSNESTWTEKFIKK